MYILGVRSQLRFSQCSFRIAVHSHSGWPNIFASKLFHRNVCIKKRCVKVSQNDHQKLHNSQQFVWSLCAWLFRCMKAKSMFNVCMCALFCPWSFAFMLNAAVLRMHLFRYPLFVISGNYLCYWCFEFLALLRHLTYLFVRVILLSHNS